MDGEAWGTDSWNRLVQDSKEGRWGNEPCCLYNQIFSQSGSTHPPVGWRWAVWDVGCGSHRSFHQLLSWSLPPKSDHTQSSSSSLLKNFNNKIIILRIESDSSENLNPSLTWLKRQRTWDLRPEPGILQSAPIWSFPTPAKYRPLANLVFPFPSPKCLHPFHSFSPVEFSYLHPYGVDVR